MAYKYIKFPGFKSKVLTLSYDDGVRQDKRLIAIMQQYGLKGTFNINGGMFSDTFDGIEKGKMTRQEALDLYIPTGMEVAIHGYRHLSLSEVDTAMALEDVITDRKVLEDLFGCVIKGMAYANGAYSDEVVELLQKSGVSYARATAPTEKFNLPTDWLRLLPTCHHKHGRLMELAKEFVELKDHSYFWARNLHMFYVWGHSYEFDLDDNWDVIEKFAEYVGNRDDIWYATNGEIFEYLQAAERLEFSVDGTYVKNPTSTDIYIDYLNQQRVVPAGKTIKI